MSNGARTFLYWSGCLLYGLLLTAALLYLRFPAEKFKQFCVASFEQALPETRCDIGALSYSFPLTLVFSDFQLNEKSSGQQSLLAAQEVQITPGLAVPGEKFFIRGKAYEGEISAALSLQSNKGEYRLEDIEVSGVNLEDIVLLEAISKRKISGRMQVTGNYTGQLGQAWYSGTGKGNVRLNKGRLQLLLPVLSLNTLDLQELYADWEFGDSVLAVEKGMFAGEELKGYFDGTLKVETFFAMSRFDVKGELKPLPPLLKKSQQAQRVFRGLRQRKKETLLSFQLGGTVMTPALHLSL